MDDGVGITKKKENHDLCKSITCCICCSCCYILCNGDRTIVWQVENNKQRNQILTSVYSILLLDGVSGREETSKKMANQKPINKGKILGIIIAVVAVLMIAMAGALWEDADKSKNYVCQMPVTGNYVVWTAVGVANALANSKVQWVPSVMFGGNGSGNNAMDAVGLKMLMDITKSFDKK